VPLASGTASAPDNATAGKLRGQAELVQQLEGIAGTAGEVWTIVHYRVSGELRTIRVDRDERYVSNICTLVNENAALW
jgi:hypothetical protein